MRRIHSILIAAALVITASAVVPASALAQHVRVGVGVHVSSGPRYVRPAYYRPYYYRPYYAPYFYGSYYYSPFYYDPFYWGAWWGGPSYYGYYSDAASLRLQIAPRQAEVYVDGYYVGIVDSFDGTFQRLDLPPGEHAIDIFLEGHRPIHEVMRFVPRAGYQIKRALEPLGPGEPEPMRPAPDPKERNAPREQRDRAPVAPQERHEYPPPPPDRSPGMRTDLRAGEAGAVAIRVQPAGAIILIDGERWDGAEGPDRLVVHVSEGPHKIEVQKEGYRTFTTEIRVGRGETVPLNISLRTSGGY
jgi:hypothetical protein